LWFAVAVAGTARVNIFKMMISWIIFLAAGFMVGAQNTSSVNTPTSKPIVPATQAPPVPTVADVPDATVKAAVVATVADIVVATAADVDDDDDDDDVTTSIPAISCPNGTVALPDQSGCKEYNVVYFEWFNGPGLVVVILMAIGGALVLFAFGVFTLNASHEAVQNSNYLSLCVFLVALLLLLLCPVPLLLKPPTGTSCSVYMVMFNLGVAIVLGVLTSRSAWVNGFFDKNGDLQKRYLGSYPRATIVILVSVLQLIVLIVVFNMETILLMKNPTEQWDELFHECSSWASTTFWAGFVFNIIISVVGNSLSCSSLDMSDNVWELKYVLLGHLMWYLWGLVELIVFFRCNDQNLAGGQAAVALLLAISLFFVYPWPKMYAIFFQSKGGRLIVEVEDEEEEKGLMNDESLTAVSSKAGMTGAGIVSIKIQDA